jgi:hypothetical protein
MFENYLLNPNAIATVFNSVEGFSQKQISEAEVTKCLEDNRWTKDWFTSLPESKDQTQDYWERHVDGAAVLGKLCVDFSGHRVPYDKVRHGTLLTEWICANSVTDFDGLAADLVTELEHFSIAASERHTS